MIQVWRYFPQFPLRLRTAFVLVLLGSMGFCRVTWGQWFTGYKNNAAINLKLDEFAAARPDLVSTIQIGTSVQGRPIRGIRINGTGGTRPNRPAVLINGVQHAREWIAAMTPMYIADQLIANYDSNPGIRDLLNEVEVIVLPVINPDGYEYTWTTNRNWRKNRAPNGDGTFGVDLNRNWGVGWGLNSGSSASTSSDIYRGPSAFSEPETRALRDFYLANPNIVSNIDFHSYSQLILYPWGYTDTQSPPDATLFQQIGDQMADSIFAVHGKDYFAGQAGLDLYLASGVSIDWTYGNQGVYSYTVELRPESSNPGFQLPAAEIIPVGQENFPAFLDLARFTAAISQGDFNYDQQFNCTDVDRLVSSIVNGSNRAEFDLNGDGALTPTDVQVWLGNAGAVNLGPGRSYPVGDGNLDGVVDGGDFNLWNANKFTSNLGWCSGNFNADVGIDGSDFNLWNANKFTSGDGIVVPEPVTYLCQLAAVWWWARRRGR